MVSLDGGNTRIVATEFVKLLEITGTSNLATESYVRYGNHQWRRWRNGGTC